MTFGKLGMDFVDSFYDHKGRHTLTNVTCDGDEHQSNAQKELLLWH